MLCNCSSGFTGPNGGPCLPCPLGTYKNNNGSSSCSMCPANTYSETLASTNTSNCLPCALQSLAPSGTSSRSQCLCAAGSTGANGGPCNDCIAGTYKGSNGSAACSPCGSGKYSVVPSAVSEAVCKMCPAVSSSSSGAGNITDCRCNVGYTGAPPNACVPCGKGYFKASLGSSACLPCTSGKFSAVLASESAANCTSCPRNAWSPAGSNAISLCICNAGFVGNDGEACAACAPGTYKPLNGSSRCILCVEGKYSNGSAATSSKACSDCPQHSYSPQNTSDITACTCNNGYTRGLGGTCIACPAGTYKDIQGSSRPCTPCEMAKYSSAIAQTNRTACIACPNNTNTILQTGSGTIADCKCNAG